MFNLTMDVLGSICQYLNVADLLALQGSCTVLRQRLMNPQKIWQKIAPGTTREAAILAYKAEHSSLPLKGGKFDLQILPDATPFSTAVDMSLPLRKEISEKCAFKPTIFGSVSALIERHGYLYVATKTGDVSVFNFSSGNKVARLINLRLHAIEGLRFTDSGEMVICYYSRLSERIQLVVARVDFPKTSDAGSNVRRCTIA